MTDARDYVFKMMTNRKGRPITVYILQAEEPNAKAFEGSYIDPVDGAEVEIELTGVWRHGTGAPSSDAYQVRLKKIR